MKEELTLRPSEEGCFDVLWSNNVHVGDIVKDVDGYFYWWPLRTNYGSWPAYALRMIADKLDELNKEWDESVRSYFEKDG